MPAQLECGQFAKSTASAPTSQTITLADPTLVPVAVMLWGANVQDETLVRQNSYYGYGISDGSYSWSTAWASRDNRTQFFVDTAFRQALAVYTLIDYSKALLYEAQLSSFAAGEFTLNWTTNNGNPDLINYLVIGSVQAKAGGFVHPAVAGDYSVTGVGFQPDLLIVASGNSALEATQNVSTAFGLGFADANLGQWAFGASRRALAYASNLHASYDLSPGVGLICYSFPFDGFLAGRGILQSMDPDGFTINAIVDATTPDRRPRWQAYLALQGDSFVVGETTQPTNGGQSVVLTGADPQATLLAMNLPDVAFAINIGVDDRTSHVNRTYADADGGAVTNMQLQMDTDYALQGYIVPGANVSPDLVLQASVSYPGNGFVVEGDYSDGDTTRRIGYVSFGADEDTLSSLMPGSGGLTATLSVDEQAVNLSLRALWMEGTNTEGKNGEIFTLTLDGTVDTILEE